MKKTAFVVVALIFSLNLFAETPKKPNPYKFGIGAAYYPALNNPIAVSLKFYMKSGHSIEFFGYDLEQNYKLAALFAPYLPISKDGRLRLILGAGLHVGFWKSEYKTNSYTTNPIVGMDGIMGMEYRIPKIPVSLEIQYQPNADIAGNNDFYYDKEWAGGTLKIVF